MTPPALLVRSASGVYSYLNEVVRNSGIQASCEADWAKRLGLGAAQALSWGKSGEA